MYDITKIDINTNDFYLITQTTESISESSNIDKEGEIYLIEEKNFKKIGQNKQILNSSITSLSCDKSGKCAIGVSGYMIQIISLKIESDQDSSSQQTVEIEEENKMQLFKNFQIYDLAFSGQRVLISGFRILSSPKSYERLSNQDEGFILYNMNKKTEWKVQAAQFYDQSLPPNLNIKSSKIYFEEDQPIILSGSEALYSFKNNERQLTIKSKFDLKGFDLCNEDSCLNLNDLVVSKDDVRFRILIAIGIITFIGIVALCVCCISRKAKIQKKIEYEESNDVSIDFLSSADGGDQYYGSDK